MCLKHLSTSWVILVCSLTMGIGTSVGGMRIIKTMGYKMVHLETYQGFSAETAAASTIIFSSYLGIPLSTTHTIGTAIMGVGAAKRLNAVRWKTVLYIIYAWLLTFPLCGSLAFFASKLYEYAGPVGLFSFFFLSLFLLLYGEVIKWLKKRRASEKGQVT